MESNPEGTHVSDVHCLEYTHARLSVALVGPRVQRNAASKHRPGPFPSDPRQRTDHVGSSVRPTVATTKRLTLKVGDRVRLNKKHRPFQKGYLPGWTEEVFFV